MHARPTRHLPPPVPRRRGLPGSDPAFAEQLKKDRRQVLFVWLDGGMSQLESWDPKPNTPFGGPFRSIQTAVPGVRISELMQNLQRS